MELTLTRQTPAQHIVWLDVVRLVAMFTVVCCHCTDPFNFYPGSIGGPAAILAQNNIKSIECVEYPELGMEAIWKIEVENFPAFILVDDKGNDFFKQLKPWNCSK